MYPLTLMLDPHSRGHVWVTFASNNQATYVIKMDINGLVNSLDKVRDCEEYDTE